MPYYYDTPIEVPITKQKQINVEIGKAIIYSGASYPTYTGAYEMMPSFNEKELQTKNKVLEENVVFHAIPVYSVSNPAGGNTVTIGELENYG